MSEHQPEIPPVEVTEHDGHRVAMREAGPPPDYPEALSAEADLNSEPSVPESTPEPKGDGRTTENGAPDTSTSGVTTYRKKHGVARRTAGAPAEHPAQAAAQEAQADGSGMTSMIVKDKRTPGINRGQVLSEAGAHWSAAQPTEAAELTQPTHGEQSVVDAPTLQAQQRERDAKQMNNLYERLNSPHFCLCQLW